MTDSPSSPATKSQITTMFRTIANIAHGRGINKNLTPEERLEMIIEACEEYLYSL